MLNHGIPLMLGIALAKNPDALERFTALSEEQRRHVIEKSADISTKQEMRSYVEGLLK